MNRARSRRRALPGFSDVKFPLGFEPYRSKLTGLKGPESPFLKLKGPFMTLNGEFFFKKYGPSRKKLGGSPVRVWNGWGYGIAFFRALNFTFRSLKFGKNRSFCGISRILLKFRPLKNIFRTLENGHSIRHQSIPPLIAGREIELIETPIL